MSTARYKAYVGGSGGKILGETGTCDSYDEAIRQAGEIAWGEDWVHAVVFIYDDEKIVGYISKTIVDCKYQPNLWSRL